MKTSHFIYALIAIILFASCGNSNTEPQNENFGNENFENYAQNDQNEFAQNGGGYQQNQAYQNGNQGMQQNNPRMQQVNYTSGNQQGTINTSTNGGKKQYDLKDTTINMVAGSMPIPSTWRATPGNPETYLAGPNGLKIFNDVSNYFHYSNEAGYNQFMEQNGNQIRRPLSMEQAFTQDFLPMTKKEGGRLIKKYPMSQLATNDRKFDAMFFKPMPEQTSFDAMVTEWESNDGTMAIVVMKHKISDYGQGRKGWGSTYSAMECKAADFQQAKQDFLYALMNVQINPQYVQAMNQKNQQATQQQMAGHQQRMNDIRSFGEQNTRNFNARSAAMDAQHNNWRANQASSDRMHQKAINNIREVSTYQDNFGNTYEVDGYHNQVYSNGNGEIITTDDYNYNPNRDNNVNGTNWEQMDATDDGWN